jgi:hypothetical protein
MLNDECFLGIHILYYNTKGSAGSTAGEKNLISFTLKLFLFFLAFSW